MLCELHSGENSLTLSDFRHSPEDEARGNPYNFFFTIHVISDGFTGHAKCEYDRKEFNNFVHSIQNLYNFRCTIAELNDIGYGSRVRFELTQTGHLTVTGTLYGHAADHSLTFRFTADQTDLLPFLKSLYQLQ